MSDKSLFDAIESRDLSAVIDNMYAYRHSLSCACPDCDLRARLSLEHRDEPKQYESNIEPNTGLRRQGEI
jgi:hypothetical protein